ncbi:MAG: hypothetical protein Q7R95_09695 [bacterium]|nr:hypothetical protein [bacterium]
MDRNSISNLTKFIEKKIEDYFESKYPIGSTISDNISKEEEADSVLSELEDVLNPSEIARYISSEMEKFALKFEPVPNFEKLSGNKLISIGSNLICNKCYRPYGSWNGPGGSMAHDHVAKIDNSIIILNHLN